MLSVCSDRGCVELGESKPKVVIQLSDKKALHTSWHCHRNSFGKSGGYFYSCWYFSSGKFNFIKIMFSLLEKWDFSDTSIFIYFFLLAGRAAEGDSSVSCYRESSSFNLILFLYYFWILFMYTMKQKLLEMNTSFLPWSMVNGFNLPEIIFNCTFPSRKTLLVNPGLGWCCWKTNQVEFSTEMNLSSRKSLIRSILFNCWNN